MREPRSSHGAGGSGTIRAFLALEMPEEIKGALAREMEALRPRLESARWVRPAALHLTLKFLGESRPAELEALTASVRPALARCAPVEVRLSGSGFFPGPRRPRVAWVGGEAPGSREVAAAIEDAAAGLGWERERRPFALHLTLARLRSPWRRESVERWLEWGRGYSAVPFTCREVVLFESRLGAGGAVYTPLERLALSGGGG